jgi:hypothetical protein
MPCAKLGRQPCSESHEGAFEEDDGTFRMQCSKIALLFLFLHKTNPPNFLICMNILDSFWIQKSLRRYV